MLMKDLLRKKRNGETLSEEEIRFWIAGVKSGSIPDYQTTAMLMAIFFRGMTIPERRALTIAMRDSGVPMDFSELKAYVIDKHSSGGIGDKTSLMLAPWLAACGLKVPMVSGRGLGFTGGTLDKLESIPGFKIDLNAENRTKALRDIGFFMCGQTAEIAPADKKIYSLRDVTETVEEISLITASILSKKLSEGLHGLVLDIKCGSGAFMKDLEEAERLAVSLTDTARAAGVDCRALITRMDFPLGEYTGNLNEVYEAIEFMQPGSEYHRIFQERIKASATQPGELQLLGGITSVKDNLTFVTTALAAQMLMMGKNLSISEALEELNFHWESGEVLRLFQKMTAFHSGDFAAYEERVAHVKQRWEHGFTFNSPADGYLTHCRGADLGNLMVELGAGRRIAEDKIDHEISLQMTAWEGKKLAKGEAICRIYKNNLSVDEQVKITTALANIFTITDRAEMPAPYIYKVI